MNEMDESEEEFVDIGVSDVPLSVQSNVDINNENENDETPFDGSMNPLHNDNNHEYNPVAVESTTQDEHRVLDHSHNHGHESIAPTKVPKWIADKLEIIFKLQKRGTTFEVSKHYFSLSYILILLINI